MDIVKVLRASAFGLVVLVVVAALATGASTTHSFVVVDLVYVAGALAAALALVAGVKGATRRQARLVGAAAATLLFAIGYIAFVAYFGDCRRDLFKVSTEQLGGAIEAPGMATHRPGK